MMVKTFGSEKGKVTFQLEEECEQTSGCGMWKRWLNREHSVRDRWEILGNAGQLSELNSLLKNLDFCPFDNRESSKSLNLDVKR